jgi:hypothetical protein
MILALQPPAAITIAPPSGTSQLPFVDLSKAKVLKPYARIKIRNATADCSYGSFAGQLQFNAWQFLHAAAKTEFAQSFTAAEADRSGILFAAQHRDFLIWNTNNLRIRDQGVFSRVDASRTYLAGRLGVAASSLLMQHRDYLYWDHVPSLWERAVNLAHISHAESVRAAQIVASAVASGRPALEPDFAFEKVSGDTALMESKGRFVNPGDTNPPVKGDMKEALGQLNAWSGFITPSPQKMYGIGTYLREQSDTTGDPSLLASVDPRPNNDATFEPVAFPKDWIRRGSFGNWLVGMGLTDAGFALRNGRGKAVTVARLPVVEIGRHQFAIIGKGSQLDSRWGVPLHWRDHPFWPIGFTDRIGVHVLGIETSVLKLISAALRTEEPGALLETEPVHTAEYPNWFSGSVAPDGTLFGLPHFDLRTAFDIRTLEFDQ